MKKTIQYTSLVLGTILFIFTLRYIGIENILKSLKIEHYSYFIIYLVISFLIFLGFVVRWFLILKCHGYSLNLIKLFNYRVAGFAISYLTPSARLGGEPVRTYFLVKEKVPFEKAMSSVFIDKSLELTANAVMTIIGAIIFLSFVVVSFEFIWLVILIIIITIGLLYFFYDRIFRGKGVFTSLIKFFALNKFHFFKGHFLKLRESELEMTRFFKNYKRVFIVSTIISFLLWFLTIFEFKVLLYAFGFEASFLQVFLVLVVVGIAYIIPIPTALGILESAQVSLFSFFGKSPHYGLGVSLVTRIRDMMWTLYGLSFLYFKGVMVNNLLKDDSNSPELCERVVYFKKWKVK